MLLNSFTRNHFFIVSIGFFFLAKLFLIISSSLALGIPRLGDDSIIYLWKSKIFLSEDSYNFRSLKDIRDQRFLQDNPSNDVSFARSNIAQRTLQESLSPTYNLLAKAAIHLTNDMRWAFALTEVIGLCLMIAGIAWLFYGLVGPLAGGVGLLLLSIAILPNQGINNFIPSTYALACSLIMWAYLWKKGINASWMLIFAGTMLTLGLHPIAKVYVAITPFLFWIKLGIKHAHKMQVFWKVLAACYFSIFLIFLLPVLSIYLTPPPSEILGNINFNTGIKLNAIAISSLFWDPIIRFNPAWFLLTLGALFFIRINHLLHPLGLLFCGTLLLLIISLIFYLPGYPGELFSRIWVLFFILTSALCGKFYEKVLSKKTGFKKAYSYIFWAILVLACITWVNKYTPTTMNWRKEVLDEKKIKHIFKNIKSDTAVIYTDSSIALQSSLMLGAEKLGAVVYPMLKNSSSLEGFIAKKKPTIIVTPIDYRLNNLAEINSKQFTPRKLGIYFPANHHFTIYRKNGYSLRKIWLNFHSESDLTFYLEIRLFEVNNKLPIKKIIPVNKNISQLDLPDNVASVEIKCPELPIWLIGLGSGTPQDEINWPWREGWELKFYPKKNKKPVTISFDLTSLLNLATASELLPLVKKSDPFISDAGGLVILKTKYWIEE